MQKIRRHKVFVSYHHELDQRRRNTFERLFAEIYDIMDSRSVKIGEIPNGLNVDEISRRIRDDHLRDATVAVVLVGRDTWRRKHVDWEIAATVRATDANPRSGLIGVLLPSHPSFSKKAYDPYTIPPRLYDNIKCGFAHLYRWSESPEEVVRWIDAAYLRRDSLIPDNSHIRFTKNWKGPRWYPQKRIAGRGG